MNFASDLAEAEIGQAQVALGVNQNVLRLEIAVNDALTVHMLQRQHNLRSVELGSLQWEAIPVTLMQVIE